MDVLPSPTTMIDRCWRMAYRVAYSAVRVWWGLRRPKHEGALVAIYVDDALLLLRSSYRRAWNLPGGGLHPWENPQAAAIRELREETGIVVAPSSLRVAGTGTGYWNGRDECVHYFVVRLSERPSLVLDNREIIAGRWVWPSELRGIKLTDAVAAYFQKFAEQ